MKTGEALNHLQHFSQKEVSTSSDMTCKAKGEQVSTTSAQGKPPILNICTRPAVHK